MKRKNFKTFFIILLTLLFLSVLFSCYNTFANVDVIDNITDPLDTDPEVEIKKIADTILTIIQIITMGTAVGLIINDGIKLLTTVDNSEKANLKRKIAYYFVGAFFIFTPVAVIKVIINTTAPIVEIL